jgi:hypothetical protein
VRRRFKDALQLPLPDPFLPVLDSELDRLAGDDSGYEYGFVGEVDDAGAAFGQGVHGSDHDFQDLAELERGAPGAPRRSGLFTR